MTAPSEPKEPSQLLESKKYRFVVNGTMPILEFDITSGSGEKVSREEDREQQSSGKQSLTVEIYNPLSGELFEAKFPRGRIEVDSDGAITYFSSNSATVNLSLFLGRNITVDMDKKTGEVLIKSPSKITLLDQEKKQAKRRRQAVTGVITDSLRFRLE